MKDTFKYMYWHENFPCNHPGWELWKVSFSQPPTVSLVWRKLRRKNRIPKIYQDVSDVNNCDMCPKVIQAAVEGYFEWVAAEIKAGRSCRISDKFKLTPHTKKKGTGVEKTVKVVPLKKFMENFKDKDTRG